MIQEKPSPFTTPQSFTTQNPPTTGLRITPETTAPDKGQVEIAAQTSSPSPPQPQTNGTTWPTPQSTNAAAVAAVLVTETLAIPASAPFEAPTQAPATETATSLDELVTAGPAPDVAEDVADALVVKVVDDIPLVEASTVASTETSQIQAPVPGTEAVRGLQPAPDLAQVSLTLPSQFYKVVCPKCGADVPKPAKVWELKGGKSKKNVLIGLFQCQDCRVKFREALTREIL